MSSLSKLLLTCLLGCSTFGAVWGQMLWPGDVNNNGIVNGIDFLYTGIAFGDSGPVRPGASTNWEAQMPSPDWVTDFPDGTNYSFADCDGNGMVDELDFEVIEENLGEVHGILIPDEYSTDNGGDAPRVSIIPQNSNIGVGGTVVFDVYLGDPDFPVENFYGVAMELSYNPDFTLGSEWTFEDDLMPWYDPDDQASEELYEVNEGAGTMQLAVTRTNQQVVSGSGKIGEVSVVVEDIIFGLTTDTLFLNINNILLIDNNLNKLPAQTDSTFVIISRPSTTNNPIKTHEIKLYPNPADDFVNIISESPITRLKIQDYSGKHVFTLTDLAPHSLELHLSLRELLLPSMIYILEIQTEQGIHSKKLFME